jgi:hypothetical protein
MDKDFINILQKLVSEQGNGALTDTKKCKAFLSDYAGSEYKKERRFVVQAVEVGAVKAITEAQDLAACKQAQVRELEEECGFSTAVAADVVDTLAQVLRGDATKTEATPQAGAPPQEASQPQNPKLTKPNLTEWAELLVRVIASDTEIEITGYKGPYNVRVNIPSQIEGLPVTAIGDGAFAQHALISVLIPNSVTRIGNGAFTQNALTSVVIPNSVTHIGIGAFADNRLASVVISNSVTRIEAEAFRKNKLESIVIPDSVTYIGAMAFRSNDIGYSNVSVPMGAKIEYEAFDPGAHVTKR